MDIPRTADWNPQEASDMLQDELTALSAEHQEVIRLRVGETLSFEDIGQRMNRSADSARKLCARAVLKLQQRLHPSDDQWQTSE